MVIRMVSITDGDKRDQKKAKNGVEERGTSEASEENQRSKRVGHSLEEEESIIVNEYQSKPSNLK